jgi:hypothetical protein
MTGPAPDAGIILPDRGSLPAKPAYAPPPIMPGTGAFLLLQEFSCGTGKSFLRDRKKSDQSTRTMPQNRHYHGTLTL